MKRNSVHVLVFCVSLFVFGLIFLSRDSLAQPPAPAPDSVYTMDLDIPGPPEALPPGPPPDLDEDWMDDMDSPFAPDMHSPMRVAMVPGFAPASPPGPPDTAGRFEKVHQKIETMRMWRLTEALNLTGEKSAKLFPVLKKYDDKRAALGMDRRKLMRALADLTKDQSASDAKFKEALDGLEANGSSMDQLKKDELKELKAILTTSEMAKFIVANEQFEREMRQTVERVRGRGAASGPNRQPGRRP
jgi:hypothetical protein